MSSLSLYIYITHTYILTILYICCTWLKVIEDLSYVVLLRKKFSYIESIPGVLLPHPSSSPFPFKVDGNYSVSPDHSWHFQGSQLAPQPHELYHDHLHHYNQLPLKITPSMSSLEALLSKLPSVVPPPLPPPPPPQAIMSMSPHHHHHQFQRPLEFMGSIAEKVAKDEIDDDDDCYRPEKDAGGESSTSMSYRRHNSFHQHQDHNLSGF